MNRDFLGDSIVVLYHDRFSTLTFYNITSQYNGSMIHCSALNDASSGMSNGVALLIVAGLY